MKRCCPAGCPLERSVLWNLQLENLRNAVAELNAQEQELISLHYGGELSMEKIRKVFSVSQMAVSKLLKKLHAKLGSSVT